MVEYRKIEPRDNSILAGIIREVFREFGADQPGTVYTDPSTDKLFELFNREGAACFVVEEEGVIGGCCGIYPTEGLPSGCVELVKFYLRKDFRGKGYGQNLLSKCLETANNEAYKSVYIESLPEFGKAVSMYRKAGFRSISKRMGRSGHFACDIWMLKTF
jgi:putative acetyltransferase